jgi:predicted DNA-binding transcriptional regulator YafY
VEVRIGVQSAPRELAVETPTSAEQIERDLAEALAGGKIFTLAVEKGGKVLVPADKIAYVEFTGAEGRPIGFGNL